MLTSLKKKVLVITASLLMAVIPVAVPAIASAADDKIGEKLKCGATELSLDDSKTNCKVEGGTTRINNLISDAINILSIVVGIIAVIMIVVGGFKYVTSGGDSSNITSAKNTIIYAIIGLVFVALAQFLVQFVLDKAIN